MSAIVDMSYFNKIANFACKICKEETLEEFEAFGQLSRVTSDCKPFSPGGRLAICTSCGLLQKPADKAWLAEIGEIYSDYAAYYQSAGVEQAVFDPISGAGNTRSSTILSKFSELFPLPKTGSVLDVGCGNGVLLTAFSKSFPDWELNGHDLSDIALAKLSTIPGFKKLFNAPLSEVVAEFDMVTMIHSLEHFPDPVQGLIDVKPLLSTDGRLLVQVPNASVSPFDYLVADHACHFSLSDLNKMLVEAGYHARVVTDEWVTKELSIVAEPGRTQDVSAPDALFVDKKKENAVKQIEWLFCVKEQALAASSEGKPFGVFGTSIAAMWLFGQLGDAITFFVDEDESRHGTLVQGKPVYRPSEVEPDAIVYAGLIPHVADSVAKRMADYRIDFRRPPMLVDNSLE